MTVDGLHVYAARVPREQHPRNLVPHFTLETVEDIAADLRDDYGQGGYQDAMDLRVLRAPGLFEYLHEEDLEPQPVSVVVEIAWAHRDGQAPKDFATVVDPDQDGLYPIGNSGWCWSEVDVKWGIYLREFSAAALREALLFDCNPDGSGVGGLREQDVIGVSPDTIADDDDRGEWAQFCRDFVVGQRVNLAGRSDAKEAGRLFFHSARGTWSKGFTSWERPERAIRELHAAAGRATVPEVHLRNGVVRVSNRV